MKEYAFVSAKVAGSASAELGGPLFLLKEASSSRVIYGRFH
jgi:hypothetical protein